MKRRSMLHGGMGRSFAIRRVRGRHDGQVRRRTWRPARDSAGDNAKVRRVLLPEHLSEGHLIFCAILRR